MLECLSQYNCSFGNTDFALNALTKAATGINIFVYCEETFTNYSAPVYLIFKLVIIK